MLLFGLDPTIFSKVSRSRVKCVFHLFIKCPMIPAVKSKLYARANMFLIINALVALQDNWLNHDHPHRVPLLSLYSLEIHRKGYNKYSSKFYGRYVVDFG